MYVVLLKIGASLAHGGVEKYYLPSSGWRISRLARDYAVIYDLDVDLTRILSFVCQSSMHTCLAAYFVLTRFIYAPALRVDGTSVASWVASFSDLVKWWGICGI